MRKCGHALFYFDAGSNCLKQDTVGFVAVVHNATSQLHLWEVCVPQADEDQKYSNC